jgi:hypothetical protein
MVEDAEGAAVATAATTAVAGTGSSSGGSSSSSSGAGTAAATQLFYVSQLLESRQREQARTQALARSVMVHNDQSFAVVAVFVPVYMM